MTEAKQFSRREFLKWTGVGATGALLAACTPKEVIVTQQVEVTREVEVEKTVEVEKEVEVQVTAPPEAQTIRVLFNNWGDFFNGLMEQLGQAYMDENPGTTVTWDFNPDWREKILTSLAAGDAPDVCYTNYTAQAALAHQGAFLPLDAYMVITGLKREDFILSMYDQSLYNGKLYCLPGGADFIALYYNKDVYREAGLDPEKPPVTAAELLEHSRAMNQVDANGAIQRVGYAPTSWDLKTWSHLFGGSWYDPQLQKVTADHPANIEALEWMKSYVDELDVNQLEAFNASLPDFWSPGNSFASKKTGFRFDGYWTYDPLDQYAPDIDYGVCFWPTLEGKPEERANYVIEGWMMAILSGAKNPDGGWAFLKHAFVDYAWKAACDTLNGNCVIDQMDEFEQCVIDKLGTDNRLSPYFHVFSETGAAGTRYWPAIPVNALYWDEVARAYDYVVRGEKSAAEALGEVTATIQAELDKALAEA
jgi:multiple sugar transport system substrate-binding protein